VPGLILVKWVNVRLNFVLLLLLLSMIFEFSFILLIFGLKVLFIFVNSQLGVKLPEIIGFRTSDCFYGLLVLNLLKNLLSFNINRSSSIVLFIF
jgi:hypothetical protein